jgi:NRAMP (natural resistance-associated macrophage protein)-like metal ion transporter
MKKIVQITLGIVTAMGGFVDIGELVFSVQAGAQFQYALIWAVLIGMVGIILYGEMSGRITAVAKKPTFDVIKQEFGKKASVGVLVAATILIVMTCAAEIGGVAIALQLLTGASYLPMVLVAILMLILIIWFLPFEWIERLFGIVGMLLCIFILVALTMHPDWNGAAKGLIPHLPKENLLLYFYFVVGIISSTMMPYELYFYSSGGIEEKWTEKDLVINKATSLIGFTLGATLAIALIMIGAQIFAPLGINPQLHGTSAIAASIPYGKTGLYIALVGIVFVVGGAAVETGLSGAYNIAQHFN